MKQLGLVMLSVAVSLMASVSEARLVCQTNQYGRAAIYNTDRGVFVDPYYSKTLSDCNYTVSISATLTCATDQNGRAALFNVYTNSYVDGYYSKSLDDCNRVLRASYDGLTCATDQNGRAAIYDYDRGIYVDRYYSKTIDECIYSIDRSQPYPQPRPQPRPEPRPQPRPQPRPEPRPQPQPRPNDAQCYLQRYPDICQNSPKNYCKDPWKHYQEHGRGEGRVWGCQP